VLAGSIQPDADAITTLVVIGETGTGVEALKRAMELMPDVAIFAIELPGLDGYDWFVR
jgi:DNA-binding NarL/FixJ family response regulator